MKTIIEVNSTNYGSTGHIMLNIAKEAREKGYNVFTFCKNSRSSTKFQIDNHYFIGNRIDRVISERLTYYTGLKNYFNTINTLLFIKKIDSIKPDLIHLHAIADPYLNMGMFFRYIKKKNIPIIWTFHEGWAMTGYCCFFALASCYKWKNICHNCPLIEFEKPTKFFDFSKFLQKKKKEWFSNINNMTIVTPSRWLASNVRQSYLKSYDIKIINNGINLDIFKPTNSNFVIKNHINNKYIVLGVAFVWNQRKGLNDFIELAKSLPNNYSVIMVGSIDANNLELPKNIIHILKTYNQTELAEIYTCADVFVNTTYEDNYPTVNLESLACGTPVLTYNTGGSPEAIDDKTGFVVKKGDIKSLIKETKRICERKPYSSSDCIKKSKHFDMRDKFNEYIELYDSILKN